MNDFQAAMRQMARDLRSLKVRWAIVGGFAVSARARPRFTNDLDAVVAVDDDADSERLVQELAAKGWRPGALVEDELTGRLRAIRMLRDDARGLPVYFDLLFNSTGIEPEIVDGATVVEVLRGLKVPVARAAHLIAMKLVSESDARAQDRQDLVDLIRRVDEAEIAAVREAVRLIAQRGFARGKDLEGDLDRWVETVARFGPDPYDPL